MSERSEVLFGTTRIPFEIRRSGRRATVALAVHGGALVVTAPAHATVDRLNSIVRGKAPWVAERMRAVYGVAENPGAREFVNGETFRYLGRQHRLRVVPDGGTGDVKLARGWLMVAPRDAESPDRVREALVQWYRQHAEERLPEHVETWAKRVGVPVPTVLVRDQRRRWGSCNRAGELRLNWRLVQAPHALIDYVVAHELVHLALGDEGHSPRFWARLGRVMPDYDSRRGRLRELGPALEW
jgi:hypothetical protein